MRLPARAPYATTPMRRFLAAHAVPGVEHHDATTGEHTRLVPGPHGPALVTVRLPSPRTAAGRPPPSPDAARLRPPLDDDEVHVEADLLLPDAADEAEVVGLVTAWLDLDAEPARLAADLGADPLLGPLLLARPGLRVPRSVDGQETALFAVLGQQVSLAAARTFAGRLLAAFGDVPDVGRDLGLARLAGPEVLVAAGPAELQRATGVTTARARALHAVAGAAADGLDLSRRADRGRTRAGLLALPGIGPWTADYVALRCLGDDDAFLPGDLVLRRALGARTPAEALARAQAWRPWRGYALLHLWTEAVFA